MDKLPGDGGGAAAPRPRVQSGQDCGPEEPGLRVPQASSRDPEKRCCDHTCQAFLSDRICPGPAGATPGTVSGSDDRHPPLFTFQHSLGHVLLPGLISGDCPPPYSEQTPTPRGLCLDPSSQPPRLQLRTWRPPRGPCHCSLSRGWGEGLARPAHASSEPCPRAALCRHPRLCGLCTWAREGLTQWKSGQWKAVQKPQSPTAALLVQATPCFHGLRDSGRFRP